MELSKFRPIIVKIIVSNAKLVLEEELRHLADGVLGVLDAVADHAGVGVDLVVIPALRIERSRVAYLHGLVAEEVDLVELIQQELEAVGLVPALGIARYEEGYLGEDVEGDLAADGVLEVHVGELALQHLHHVLADVVDLDTRSEPNCVPDRTSRSRCAPPCCSCALWGRC